MYSAGIVDWTKEELTNIEGPKGSWRWTEACTKEVLLQNYTGQRKKEQKAGLE